MLSKPNFYQVLKGVIISVIFSLLCVLIFALLIKVFCFSSKVIKPVNQAIKILAVIIGTLFSVSPPKGFIKGGIVGVGGTFIQYLIYGIIAKNLTFGLSQVLDLIFGLVIGIIVGVICSNLKRNVV